MQRPQHRAQIAMLLVISQPRRTPVQILLQQRHRIVQGPRAIMDRRLAIGHIALILHGDLGIGPLDRESARQNQPCP